MLNDFLKKVEDKSLKIGIIGLGYVGLPLALSFLKKGFEVYGIDISKVKVEMLNDGISYVQDVSSDEIKRFVESGQFKVYSDYSVISDLDAVSITVPTPLSKSKNPDLSYVSHAVQNTLNNLKNKPFLIVLESTTYPGTTKEFIAEPLEKAGIKAGQEVFVAFSPERVDPGNKRFSVENTPKIMGGYTQNCITAAKSLYSKIIKQIVPVQTLEEAEMAKLLENTFRAVNIALVNELTLMCDRMGINIWNVIKAASTKPFGFMPFYPGPGIGGHCIPLDPEYLLWKGKTVGFYNRFIELASDINANMPRFVVDKIVRILNGFGKPLKNSKILVLGVTYKKDVSDLRESPALDIMKILNSYGAIVNYSDPFHSKLFFEGEMYNSVKLEPENISLFDLIVLITNHSSFDYPLIAENAKAILDTRNAFDGIEGENIFKL